MGLVKGDPLVLVTLFFGAAVLSMGGIYALAPKLLDRPDFGLITLVAALGVSLVFSILIIGRIFWIVGRPVRGAKAETASKSK